MLFAVCFTLFALVAACGGGRVATVGGYGDTCEVCGSGCLTGPIWGPNTSSCRFYGGNGCLYNHIGCINLGDGSTYSDCVCGKQCTGCYSVGGPCRSGGCGVRCGGCVVCGGDLIDIVDFADLGLVP